MVVGVMKTRGQLSCHETAINLEVCIIFADIRNIAALSAKCIGKIPMDRIDIQILSILQKNSQISMALLSEQVGLSLSACHRRVKILENDGKISHYAARVNREAVGLNIQVFIEIKLKSNSRVDFDAFEEAIARIDDVLECHVISGEFDYLIRVAAPNSSGYESVLMDRLANIPAVLHTKTMLSLRTAKEFRGYNLEGLAT